jgi:hypothetical protein
MNGSLVAIVAAADPSKSPNGALGLLVFLVLAVVVVFLFRSMNHHLRKAARMKAEDEARRSADGSPQAPPPHLQRYRRRP